MMFIALLSVYSLFVTILLSFLLRKTFHYRNWYFKLLIDSKSDFRVERFFSELKTIFERIYPSLEALKSKKGKKPVDYCFQFRFLIWWKFFGSETLQKALRDFNRSDFLKTFLKLPTNKYTRENFHYFRKKLKSEQLELWGTELIIEFHKKKVVTFKTIVMDSFPVKSFLNTSKCLKIPKINYQTLKQFITTINLDEIVKIIDSSPKKCNKLKTKLLALLVKEIWDLQTWNRCWKVLTGEQARKVGISLPYEYKSLGSLKSIENEVYAKFKGLNIEEKLLALTVSTLQKITKLPKDFRPKTLKDLNGTWHKPHRWRDLGSSHYYCASKHEYGFGRGGLILIDEELEIPLMIGLTPKYKQGIESIKKFIENVPIEFKTLLQHSTFLADSEFGILDIITHLKEKITKIIRIPSYGASKEKIKISTADRNERKTVERVIARLENNWSLEHPRHLGTDYANFHLQLARFCDILQVVFNRKIENKFHPHAIIPIRG